MRGEAEAEAEVLLLQETEVADTRWPAVRAAVLEAELLVQGPGLVDPDLQKAVIAVGI